MEAAQVTARSIAEWRSKYFHLAMRRGRKTAKVAMARRLAIALYWMWRKYGKVLYHGRTFVGYCGEYHAHVSETVRQPVDLFRKADNFSLFDRYDFRASDSPGFTTSISFVNKGKSVFDYVGRYAGMPEVVSSVEDGIDRLAGPMVWANEIATHSECWGLVPITTSDLPSRIE